MWNNFFSPAAFPAQGGPVDTLGFMCEAGWAPWVQYGDVTLNDYYDVDRWCRWFDHNSPANSAFVSGVLAERRRGGMWVPWVGHLDALRTNTRCSLGGVVSPVQHQVISRDSYYADWCIRPIIRVSVGTVWNVGLSIYVVHLLSGYWPRAQDELNGIANAMLQIIPQRTAALIIGDMNIDLLTVQNPTVPAGWRIVRTGVATHINMQTGTTSELDWGLLFDPYRHCGTVNVVPTQRYKSGFNTSDHSVLTYNLSM